MAYAPTDWINDETPLDAEHMDHMEGGISQAHSLLEQKVDRSSVVAAASVIVANRLAADDAHPAFQIDGDGTLRWGDGINPPGTTLADTGGGFVTLNGKLIVTGNTVVQGFLQTVGDARIAGRVLLGAGFDGTIERVAPQKVKVRNVLVLGVGGDLAINAGALTPTHSVHRVTAPAGGNFNTINPGVDGELLTLINQSGGPLFFDASGNIGLGAGIPNAAARVFVYHLGAAKWYSNA